MTTASKRKGGEKRKTEAKTGRRVYDLPREIGKGHFAELKNYVCASKESMHGVWMRS